MSSAMDEDAPALARVAAQAVAVLNDATTESVDYPGLAGLRDTEAVLGALARLADELQETTAHLTGYLTDQLDAGRLLPAQGTTQPPTSAVATARGALTDVRDAAAQMSSLLTQAELALLAVEPRHG